MDIVFFFLMYLLHCTKSGVRKEDTTKLFALIKPELEKIWDKLYLRDMSSQLEGKAGMSVD